MSLNDDRTDRMIPIVGLRNAIGVDFDYLENRVYWSDVTDNSISKISIGGTGYEKIIKPRKKTLCLALIWPKFLFLLNNCISSEQGVLIALVGRERGHPLTFTLYHDLHPPFPLFPHPPTPAISNQIQNSW